MKGSVVSMMLSLGVHGVSGASRSGLKRLMIDLGGENEERYLCRGSFLTNGFAGGLYLMLRWNLLDGDDLAEGCSSGSLVSCSSYVES